MGVTIETWRARIGLHSQPNKSPRTTTTQGMVTGGGSFPCRPRHVLLVIGLLLLLSGNVELNPGPSSRRQQPPQQNTSSKLYTNKEESFTTTEVLEILQNPDLSRVINQPPVKPRAGQAFLYHFTDANKRDDWRCDQYHFHHDATREQPKADPKFKKLFFVIKTKVGKDKRFKKHAYILLGEDNNLVLFQYIGNERIAEVLPHGNSKNTSEPYTRLCPSVIRAIKDVSSNYTETLRCLNQQASSSTVPEVYKPRSRLHVMNTRYRGQRDCTKEARTNRLGITGDKTTYNLTAFLTKDIEVGKVFPRKGKRKQPKRLKNLQQISCKQIVRAPLGCLPYDERVHGSQDDLEPQEGTRNKNTTPQTPLGFDLVHSNDDSSAADNDNKPSLESETSQASKHYHLTSDESNAIQMANRDNTDLGASEAADFLKIILEDQCITSKNSITVDALSQHFKENDLTHSLSEDGDFQVSCQDNNQSNSDIAERNSGDTTLTQTAPDPEIENVNNEETQLAPLEKFIQVIFNNGQLGQMIKLLQHLHSTWNVRQQQHKAAEDQAVESVASADEQTCFNDNGLQPRMLSTSLPFTASTLITQVRSLWVSDFKTTSDCLLKTENICSIVQQNINSDTMLSLMTSLVVGAFNMQTDIVEFVETLKERPGHLEPPGNNIIADVSSHVRYRIGRYTVTGQDVMKLNKTSWLDDSVIHAYLSLLEERFSKEGKKIFIFECFLAKFWEKKNYGVWLYKEVTLMEYTWILMPICQHSHWILLAANIREGSVCVINSKPSDVTQREILHHWSEYMAHRSRETRENLSDWREIQCPIFPQTDGSSCGMFILMAAEALLSGVAPCAMRNCHVTGYREYVKQEIVNAAVTQAGDIEESNVQSSEEVEIIESSSSTNQNTRKLHAETENRRKIISTGTSVIDSQQESVICEELVDGISDMKMEPSTVKKQERLDTSGGMTEDTNFIVGDSIHTMDLGSMEIEATSEITPSDLHDTTPGACPADLRSYCEELFQNQKSSFVALTLVCLMKGHLQLTTLECQKHSSPLKYYIKWGCQLCNCGETTNAQIRNAFLGLEKLVLISNMNTCVTLRCPEIQKTISTVIADHLQDYIDIIDLKFIYHYLRIHTQDGGFHVWLKGKMVKDLARRFAKEVLQNNLALVLSHDSCGYFHFNVMLRKAVQHLLKSEDFHSILENTDKTFGGTFIHWMCFGRNAELFKSLSFWLTDSQKAGCLIPCCISGNSSIVQLLCSETDLTECQKIPKHPQSLPGITHKMESPLVIIESYGTHALPPLHLSSLYGHTGVVSFLLESGFDVNEQLVDGSGNSIPFQAGSTAALVAATMGNIDIAKCLIQHSADLNLHDIMFNAPIHSACRSGKHDLVALISRQCCISEGDAEGDTPLHIACERGDVDIVSMLLERGADCTLLNYKNEMPLDIVCKKGFLEVAKVILNQRGYPLPYDGSNSPLHKACTGGFTDIIELLLEYDADRSVTVDDQHPLLIAAYSNNIDVVQMLLHMNAARVVLCDTHITATCLSKGHILMVKLLLENQACVSGTGMYSPMAITCKMGDVEIVKPLLDKGASVTGTDMNEYSALTIACDRGDVEFVKLLLEKGASVSGSDRYGYSPLTIACDRGDIEIVKLLLENGVSVSGSDRYGYSALARACWSGHIEVVKLLLEKWASVAGTERYWYSALTVACGGGDIEIVKLLLEKGVSVSGSDRFGYSLLAHACERGDIEIVKLLLEKGVSVSGSDRYGYSALATACGRGDIEIVKLLLEKGVSVSGSDIDWDSALTSACERGNVEIVKLLLEKGASVSGTERYGYSALARACRRGDIEIVKLLLEKGVSVSGSDIDWDSALASACETGDVEIVKLLLEKGVSVSGNDRYGYSALAIACGRGDIEIVKLLLEKRVSLSGSDIDWDSALASACERGDIEIVKLLLEKGVSVAGSDIDWDSALTSACERGNVEIVKLLLEKGASVSGTERYGYSALASACGRGDIEIVKLLLEKGVSVSGSDIDWDSALASACETGDVEIVKLLLEKGVSVSGSDIDWDSALARACWSGHIEVVKLLLEKWASVAGTERYWYSALAIACGRGDIEIVKLLLLEKGVSVSGSDRYGYSALTIACGRGDIEIVKLLLEKGVSVSGSDRYGYSPLTLACDRGDIEIVKLLLLEKGVSVSGSDRYGYSALASACKRGNVEIVKLLLEKGVSVSGSDRYGYSALTSACGRGHIEIVKLLLEKGVSVSGSDRYGYSALASACGRGDVEIVKLLLEKGVSVSGSDRYGYSPLTIACERGDIEIVKLLLEKGVSVSGSDIDWDSALASACESGDVEIVKLMLEKGASMSVTDSYGYSLLAHACERGDIEIVKLLLEKGDSVSGSDIIGDSALTIACERGDIEIVKLLLEKGVSVSGSDIDWDSALASACESGDVEILKLLLEKGVSVSGSDIDWDSALASACETGDVEIVKLLLEKGVSVAGSDIDGYLLLTIACDRGQIEIVKLLLEKGDVYSLLAMACEKGDIAIVKLLLEIGAREPSVYRNFRLLIKRLQNLASIIDIQSLLKWVLTNKYFAIFRMLLTILPPGAILKFFLHEACHQNSPQTLLLLTEICDEICLQNTLTATESLKNIKCIEILKLLNTEVAGYDLLHIVVACGNINLVRSYFENFPFSDHADTCVIIASRYGHTPIVEYLLHKCNKNITPNTYSGRCNVRRFFHNLSTSIVTKYREVRTALYEACCQGHIDIVRLLLQYDMYRTDQAVSSSLHLVCRRGNIDMLQLLLDSEAYVDHVDQNGNTGLYICTENGRVLAMQLLLEKGANPSHANNEGKAPFHAAIENNNLKAVVLLLRYTTKLSNVPVSKLNNCELFKFVSDHIPPPTLTSADPDGNSLLHHAVRYGFPDSVATLLERDVDGSLVNCKKETAMHIAAERGCQRSVRLLIQYHYTSDVENVDKQTPLHCAASEGHLNIVKDLIECNSNISLKGCLHYAAKSGHTETVQHLVNKGAVTNETDCQSDTPLHLACESGNINTVEVLLLSSADVNAVGHKGRTPLHIACARGYDRIVNYLLDHGADPNMKNKFNNTPLLSAVVEGHLDVIKLMMLKGAKSQIAGANGSNYLIACCMRGHKDVARYLLENGADISSKDIQCISPLSVSLSDIVEEERENIDCILKTGRSGIEGMTSLHAAMDGNHFDLAEYLMNQGADVLEDDQYGKSILLKVCEKGNSKVTKAFLSSESVFPSMLKKHIKKGFSMKNIPASHHSEKNSKDSLKVREIGNDVIEVIDEPDTDFVPVPPVKVASDCGHDDVASVLIAYSAGWLSDMDDSHLYESISPLHLAYDAGFMDIVACLLSSSTNSNAIDSHGYTIFHKACERGDVKVCKIILKLKRNDGNPEVCMKTKYGEMFCHIASRKGYMHILKMCLKVGMDVTHVTEEGDNALHLACSYDKHRVCAFLLDTSPSLAWIKNHNGFTPLDIVMRRGNNKIARIFFAHAKLTQYGRMQDVIWMYLRESMDNINRLNLLVRCSNVMDLTDDHGNTPFHVASMVSSNRATDCLLKHDKKDCVKLKNRNGDTPLHIASEQGHSAVVRSLLTQCHVNAINNYNETALHLSSLHAHLDTVVALLGAGACVDSRNFQGDSPLHLLLYGCTNKPNNDFTHIITILRHCLASGAGPCQNDLGNTPLHVACCTGKIVVVGELLSGYKDLCMRNTFGKTTLHVACERGQSVIVDLLLEVMWLRRSFGEEFNDSMNHQDAVNGSTPLHLASRCSGQAVLLLVEHGANTTIKDNDGNTPICVAYLTGQKENVKHLLPHTPYLDINGSGDTLLHAACRSDQTDMFQIIIDWLGSVGPKIAGNTVNASNCTRQTSLHLAAANGNSYFVEQLLLMGAMPHNPDTSRKTALHYACIGRFVLVVAHLLKHGAHVNVCDDFIRTSLHYACESGSLDIAEMLTKAGGDPYIRDKDGRTPLDLCSHQHRAIIMKSLRFKRKRQSTCSGDPQYSSKRARCDNTYMYRRGCTFEDTETCQHTRSVSHFRRSLSVGETPRRVSSDDLCLQNE